MKEKSHEERKQRFVQDLKEGNSVIVSSLSLSHTHTSSFSLLFFPFKTFTATGTNLALQFNKGVGDDAPHDLQPSKDCVDFDREIGKVNKRNSS